MADSQPSMRVVIVRERDTYVAQCLEFDVAGFGPTAEDAKSAFVDAWIRHVGGLLSVGEDPFGPDWRRVDPRYLAAWNAAAQTSPAPGDPIDIPAFTLVKRSALEQEAPDPQAVPSEYPHHFVTRSAA